MVCQYDLDDKHPSLLITFMIIPYLYNSFSVSIQKVIYFLTYPASQLIHMPGIHSLFCFAQVQVSGKHLPLVQLQLGHCLLPKWINMFNISYVYGNLS